MNSNSDPLELEAGETFPEHLDRVVDQGNSVWRSGSGCARILVFLALILLLAAGAVWYTIAEAKRIPDFYAKVLRSENPQSRIDGQQFQRNMIRLQNSARQRKPWKVEIFQDQINGWLANELPQKFPDSIPAEIQDPRAIFSADEVKLAFRYRSNGIEAVVVVTANIFCTDEPNEIAVEVKDVRAGFVPLPAGPWIDKVADSVRKAGIPIFWSTQEDSPVAIFSIPEYLSAKGDDQRVVIEFIELLPGKLAIAGKTEEISPPSKSEKPVSGQGAAELPAGIPASVPKHEDSPGNSMKKSPVR